MSRPLAKALKIAVSIIVLLTLLVAGGIGYIWYTGQHTPNNSSALQAPISPKPIPVIKPTIPPDNARVGAAVESLTSPITPGTTASITVKTTATATCSISVVYDKTPSKDSGLSKQIADDYGLVSWTWYVEQSVPVGKWPVKVTCVRGKLSGFVQGDLYVVKQLSE